MKKLFSLLTFFTLVAFPLIGIGVAFAQSNPCTGGTINPTTGACNVIITGNTTPAPGASGTGSINTSGNGTSNSTLTSCGSNCNLGYVPLEPVPGLTTGDLTSSNSLGNIVDAVYKIMITAGALIAVASLVFGGIQYMTSMSPNMKNAGITRAQAAIWGILLIAATWLILNTVNPRLLSFTLNPCPQGQGACTVTGTGNTPTTSTGNVYSNTTFQQAVQNLQTTDDSIKTMTDAERQQTYNPTTCASISQQQTEVAQTAGSQGCVVTTKGVYGSAGAVQCSSYRTQYATFGDQLAVCQANGNN